MTTKPRFSSRRPAIDITNVANKSSIATFLASTLLTWPWIRRKASRVVWNEARFSSAKKFKAQEDNMKNVFEALTLIDHPNIVKFHKYWTDMGDKKEPRLIFITEYMSSGSLKQFLKTTKRNNRKVQLQSWKRWCIQILSALK